LKEGTMNIYQWKQMIFSVNSFSEIDSIVREADQKTIIFVDVDSTLIVPINPLLHPEMFSKYKDRVRDLYQLISPEQKHFVNHQIVAQAAMIVEEGSISWIKKMQGYQRAILALTAGKKGRFDHTDKEFHRIRAEQLKQVGIDFSVHCFPDMEFRSLSPTYGDYPALMGGIIYSCGLNNSKGAVVREMLKIYPQFERIILIDDKKKHLESSAQEVSKTKVNFLGFHYHGADLLKSEHPVSEKEFIEYLESLIEKTKQIDWILRDSK
jgi:hypothetical protein